MILQYKRRRGREREREGSIQRLRLSKVEVTCEMADCFFFPGCTTLLFTIIEHFCEAV